MTANVPAKIPVTDWKVLFMVFLKQKSPKLLGKDTRSLFAFLFSSFISLLHFFLLQSIAMAYLFQVPN